jgi:phosphocarrier protein HPr
MFQKEIVINNKTGLHARPASELVELCTKFESEIVLMTEEAEELDGKSIISILSGGVYPGSKVILQVEGLDEKTAGPQVATFLENLPD